MVKIKILEVHKGTAKIEYDDGSAETIKFIDAAKFKVTHKDKEYYVDCYCLDATESDSYVVRVYDSTDGMDITDINWLNEHEISFTDADSSGTVYDNGLQLEDEDVEKTIMDVLFGDNPLIIPF